MLSTVRRLGVRGPAVVAIFLIGLFAIGCSGAALQGVGAPGAPAALRGLADKVLTERSSTEDVTGQVVDLGARIKNLEATERALQAIMDRATEIKDVLSVQAELTKVRGQIEEMTAEKGHLVEQAAMSTLTVTFSLKPNPVR